jgi:hypothetical protein
MLRDQQPEKKQQESFAISGPERLELYCLGLLLQGDTKKLYTEFFEAITPADIKHMGVRRIVESLLPYMEKETPFEVADFAKSLSKELLPVLDEAYLWDISVSTEKSELFVKEWARTLKEVKKSILKRKMRDVSDRIRTASEEESSEIQESLAKLASQYALLEKTS